MADRDREDQLASSFVVLACIELITSLMTIYSKENKIIWYFRIINSLSMIILSYFIFDANNHHYQDGAGSPLLFVLPCSIIIFIICEIGNLGIDISKIYLSLFSQNEHNPENIIYFLHLIILILCFYNFKKIFN